MRSLSAFAIGAFIVVAAVAPRALADTKPTTGQTLVRFVPPPSLATGGRPTASAAAMYVATANAIGVNAVTHQPWSTTFPVSSVDYQVATASNQSSSAATGRSAPKPFIVTADLASSAPLMSAMGRHDLFTSITITFAPASGSGGTSHTITLSDATITSYKTITAPNTKPSVQLSFVYQKITWTWSGANAGSATE
jgi:type VI secretion system Hcp family effector